ncbi:MAG: alpha-galactosidase, partial [Bacteroidia bacterium]|nr:alpha-galactosidase [Bacteroidia bacterium]
MKRISIAFLTGLALSLAGYAGPDTGSREWITKNFIKGQIPPFSFMYGGKDSRTFIRSWDFRKELLSTIDPDLSKILYSWRDPKTGLLVKCTVTAFSDFPVAEWIIEFKNTSKTNTPVLEKVRAVDYSFRFEKEGAVTLHHSRGSSGEKSDFESYDDVLPVGGNIYMTPIRGRSSHTTAFPFFNIEMPGGQGVLTAIGWTGKWYADVKQPDPGSCALIAGMERMKLFLYPDEEIRTPEICLLFWKGPDRIIGHNLFRQFVLKHHSRKINGKFAELPLAATLGGGGIAPCDQFNCATENWCVDVAERYKQFDVVPEVLWIDAGWYTGCGSWWEKAGNWTVNKLAF